MCYLVQKASAVPSKAAYCQLLEVHRAFWDSYGFLCPPSPLLHILHNRQRGPKTTFGLTLHRHLY